MSSIDIVIPNYNYARFLPACVGSVQAQDHCDIRILIVDNASTDDSVAVARALAASDNRIEVSAHEFNLGPHASINEGLDWARSDYLIVLCADDMLAPGALSSAAFILDQSPQVAMAYGAYETVTTTPNARVAEPHPSFAIENGNDFITRFCGKMVLTVAPVIRTSAQKAVGHYRPEIFHTDDLEMLLRIATVGAVAETKSITAFQRWHGANLSLVTSADAVARWHEEAGLFQSFFAHEGAHLPHREACERLARQSLSARAYWSALSQLCRGNFAAAYAVMKFSLTTAPRNALLPPLGQLRHIDAPLARVLKLLRPRSI